MSAGRNDPCPCGSGRKYKHCCLPAAGVGPAPASSGPREGAASGFDSAQLLALFRSNRHAELEARLRLLVARHSGVAFLWGLLGTTLEMQGRDGIEALLRATAIEPANFDANTSLGVALRNRGRLTEAAAAFSKALSSQPDNPAAQFNMGEMWRLLGQHAQAEPVLRTLVGAQPAFVEAIVSLSDVLAELGFDAEAERFCRDAIARAPGFPLAYFCLGNILRKTNRLPESRAAYAEAIRTDSGFAAAYDSMGCVLLEMGMAADAEHCHREALRLLPGFPNALLNLGRLFDEGGRFVEAEPLYREAVRVLPGDSSALERLGNVLHELGKEDEAEACLDAALRCDASHPRIRFARTMLALPVVARDAGHAAKASGRFAAALDDLAAWRGSANGQAMTAPLLAELPLPFSLAYRDGNHLAVLSRFADLYSRDLGDEPEGEARERRTRIRLLIVSHHVRRHSVWDIVLRGLLMHLDRSRFEIAIYHLGNQEDGETAAARALADLWRDRRTVAGADGWLAAARSDRPDVIFYPELGMASLSYMLAAHRLAPLQIAGWGHPLTSGLATIDLFFSGALIEPPDAQAHYRERLVLLPGTGCCTEALPIPAAPVDDLAAILGTRSGPRFVIAQRAIKFDPADDSLFADLAARVADGVFILLRDPVADWATDVVVARLRQAFLVHGADPGRQIVVLPWQAADHFFGLLDACDVYLDCPAFSGYTTAWQALHAGLPVVTYEGDCLRRRLASGLLRKVGIADSVATSRAAYVEIAVQLANESRDPASRARRRQGVRDAAKRADGDLAVVRAFENEIAAALDGMRTRDITH